MNIKIFVCDDDLGVLELMTTILKENNYNVEFVANGKGIQNKIKKFKPNLILLDIWMPGIDGKQVAKLLKKDPETKKIPIIIISALNDVGKIVKEVGADDFIAKPFDIEVLLSLVEKYTKDKLLY